MDIFCEFLLSSIGEWGGGLYYVLITDRLIANYSYQGNNSFKKGVIQKFILGVGHY